MAKVNQTLTEHRSSTETNSAQSVDGRTAGAAVREGAELPESRGLPEVKSRLTKMVPQDQQLQGEDSLLFKASKGLHL